MMRQIRLNRWAWPLAAWIALFSLYAQAASWTATGAMPEAREYHTSTLLLNGKVLVVGGNYFDSQTGNFNKLASAALYDPAATTWVATASMPQARQDHTATLLPNGKVLVVGGAYDSIGHLLSSAILYDPMAGSWTATGSLPGQRKYHTATLLSNGKVLVAGGSDNNGYINSAVLYDPTTGVWSSTGPMPTALVGHTATLLPSGKVLVVGGYSNGTYSANAALYDPAKGTWASTGPMPTGRYYHSATLLTNGRVLVAGGYNNTGFLADAVLYNPATGTWSATGSMPNTRMFHAASLLPNGKVLVTGGYYIDHGKTVDLANSVIYDPATGAWAVTTPMLTGRSGFSATLLANGKVLTAAGLNHDSGQPASLASAELYTPDTGGPNDPDFVVTGIALVPVSPGVNTAFTASVTVKNQGKSAGDGGKLLVWANQGAAAACGASAGQSVDVGVLAAGASKTVAVAGLKSATAGTKTLRAFVDGACTTVEVTQGNNQRTASYRVHGLQPDFVVGAVTLNPASPKANTGFTASVTVTNQGSAAGDAGYLDVWADQPNAQPCGADGDAWAAVGTLAAGASKTLTVNLLAGTAGAKTLRAFVDSWCGTSESNEDNNQAAKSYTAQ